jgi:hypothetical protein
MLAGRQQARRLCQMGRAFSPVLQYQPLPVRKEDTMTILIPSVVGLVACPLLGINPFRVFISLVLAWIVLVIFSAL